MLRNCTVLVALALSTPALADDVGLRVMVQPWTPWADDDTAYRVVDDPTLISGALHDGWADQAQTIHDQLVALLGQGDLIASGVTMSGIDLRVPEPTLSVSSLGGGAGAAPLDLVWTLRFDDVHVAAELTTPTVLGSWADPRVSLDFDLTVTVPVGVGTDVAAPFTTTASADQQLLVISDVRVDSENLVADIALAVTRLFVDPDTLLEDQGNGALQGMNGTIVGMLGQVLATANGAVSSVVPAGMVRLSAWAEEGVPLTLAFGVIGPLPDGPAGAVSGTFRSTTSDGLLTTKGTCESIPLSAKRKTGPRPILNPWGDLGEEPLEPLDASFQCGEPDENGVATYTLVGLSAAFPNRIAVGSDSGCDTSNPASIRDVFHVDGMPDRLLPADLARPYDLVAEVYRDLCGAQTPEVQTWYEEHVDPVINPADAVWSVVDDGAWLRFSTEIAAPLASPTLTAPVIELQYTLR
jgi:hypothetical protein